MDLRAEARRIRVFVAAGAFMVFALGFVVGVVLTRWIG